MNLIHFPTEFKTDIYIKNQTHPPHIFDLLIFLQYTVFSVSIYHLTGSSEFILKKTYITINSLLVLDHSKN